jgi:hypothetical protein
MRDCLYLIEISQEIKTFWSYLKLFFQNVGFQIPLVSKYFQNQAYLGFQGFQILNAFFLF